MINGVFDLVTHEISCHLFGGICDAGPLRLEAAGKKGIPQLVVPAKTDILSFSTGLGPPERFRGRRAWMHNPDLGLVKLNMEEITLVGETITDKLNRAVGPTAMIIPKGGLSSYGKGWEEFADEEADLTLIEILKKKLKPEIKILEVDAGINDKRFAETATDLLDEMFKKESEKGKKG